MVFKENLKEFNEVKKLSRNLQARFVYDSNIAPGHDGSFTPIKYRLNDEELEKLIRMRPINFKRLSLKSPKYLLCNAGVNNISISPSGDVYPCVGIREKVGNVLEDSIDKIQSAPLLEKLREGKVSYLKSCKNCDLIPYCERCYGLAQLEDKDLWGKSKEACRVAKIVKRVAEERLKKRQKQMTETRI